MKSAVETVNPTRVRLTVEVPFDELRPSVDAAYRRIAQQVSLPGFRKGHVPPRLIDQRVGRGMVLEEAVNEALPRFYSQAVRENGVSVLGQPEVDVTEFADGADLRFTAEVDVRPQLDLPDYEGLAVTVDDAVVTEEDVEEQLQALRERFAVLTGVDRPVQEGDFVSLDLVARQGEAEVEDGTARNVSHEVGSNQMLDGLDDVLPGLTVGESRTFPSTLPGGRHAGEEVTVEVTVRAVRVRELPELDDEFAQTASEFDTLDELRDDVRTRLERVRRMEQGAQARDRVLEAMLAAVDVPVPEGLVEAEVREHLAAEERSEDEEHRAEVAAETSHALRAQFLLDALAVKEQVRVGEAELTEHLLRRAAALGVPPDQFAQQVVQAGRVPMLVGEVARAKALAAVLRRASVTDASGRPVDLAALDEPAAEAAEPAADEEATERVEAAEPAEAADQR